MKLTIVGCGDAFGSGGRLQTSYLVEAAGTRFLIDCGATAIIGFTKIGGVPISTTHAITGAILGVGTARNVRSVRWIWGQRIVTAWLLTIPCAAFIAALTYLLLHWLIEPLLK